MTFEQWQKLYSVARDRADRISFLVIERARKVSKEAGLDPQLLGIHPHNAMAAYKCGNPWPEVDYKKVRKVLWLLKRSFLPYRLLDSYTDRIWKQVDR